MDKQSMSSDKISMKSEIHLVQNSNSMEVSKVSRIVAFIIIVISIFIAVFCSAIYHEQPSLPDQYRYVIENWENEPIINIRPSRVGCDEYFTAYTFSGTIDGCDCSSSSSVMYGGQVFSYSCTSEQLANKCVVVNSTQTKEFTLWKLNQQILQLCVDRAIGFNYIKSDCSIAGYKRCGVTKGDTLNANMFCMPSNVDCPINSIFYGNVAPDSTFSSIIDDGVNKIFISRASTTNQPLVYSRVSRGRGECLDFKKFHYIDSLTEEYTLIRGKNNTCTVTNTDLRFKVLFQISEENYMSANNYLKTISSLPQYPLTSNNQYFFLTREYIPWNQTGECRVTHLPYFVNLKSNIVHIQNLWIACIVFNWLVALFYGVITSYLRLKYQWKIKNWYIIPVLALLFTQTVITIVTFSATVNMDRSVKSMSAAQCSDNQTNHMVSSFSDEFSQSVLSYQVVLFIFVLVLMIFTVFFMKTIFLLVNFNVKKMSLKNEIDVLSNDKTNDKNNAKQFRQSINDELIGHTQHLGGFDNASELNRHGNDKNRQNMLVVNKSDNGNNGNNNGDSNDNNSNDNNGNNSGQNLKKGLMASRKGSENDRNGDFLNQLDNLGDGSDDTQTQKNSNNNGNKGYDNENKNNRDDDNNNNGQNSMNKNGQDQNGRQNSSNNKQYLKNNMEQINEEGETNDKNDLNKHKTKKGENSSDFQSKNNGLLQSNQNGQAIKSFDHLDNLLDNNDWEFQIDDYVKKHREKQFISNRNGTAYEVPKPREKYLKHKFQKKLQSSNSFDIENTESPQKIKDSQQTLSVVQQQQQQQQQDKNTTKL